MKYSLVFAVPRSGTTYLHQALGYLRETEGMIGQLVPVALFHLVNQTISEHQYEALCGCPPRAIEIYLRGVYNSRLRALHYWWRAPL